MTASVPWQLSVPPVIWGETGCVHDADHGHRARPARRDMGGLVGAAGDEPGLLEPPDIGEIGRRVALPP